MHKATPKIFLSTPSARRATLRFFFFFGKIDMIYIHAHRGAGDPMLANLGEQAVLFLSTPSARRATYNIKRVIGAH